MEKLYNGSRTGRIRKNSHISDSEDEEHAFQDPEEE